MVATQVGLLDFDAAVKDQRWDALVPTEQARVLGLLTERIAYNARTQTVELALRMGEIGTLDELQTAGG